MHTAVEGVYQDDVIRLTEPPPAVPAGTLALVTFLPSSGVDLRQHGLGAEDAAELRARLSAFAEDWESPEMACYDDCHAGRNRSRGPGGGRRSRVGGLLNNTKPLRGTGLNK